MNIDDIESALNYLKGEILVGRLDIRRELERGNNVLSVLYLDRLGRELAKNTIIPRLKKPVDEYRIN